MKIKILAVIVFIFALSLRLWNLNQMGRWWDENWYQEKGYYFIELIKKGDFSNPYWYTGAADHPPLSNYFYGLTSYMDLIRYDSNAKPIIQVKGMQKGAPVFNYDLTYSRMISVIITSLAVVLVFLLASRYFSLFVGLSSSLIMAMLPHLLGLSQLVDLESWIIFTFTAAVFSFFLYLEKNKKIFLILTGIFSGLSIAVKQSDILIFVLLLAIFYVWKKKTKNNTIKYFHLFYIFLIAAISFIIVYPMPLLNLPAFIKFTYDLWFKNEGKIPELLFGIHLGAPFFYYIIAFLVTTPLAILLLSLFGIKAALNKKTTWFYLAIIIWFLAPFLLSFFHYRTNMVRFIIEFYAPLSILAAIGLENLIKLFTKNLVLKYSLIVPVFIYLLLILINITPLYLDYYNELVGGTKNVYENKLFFLGWFGEGLKAPGMYLAKNASSKSLIGLALNPEQTLYKVPSLNYETFNPLKKYDYVVVNDFIITRNGFKVEQLKKDYYPIYEENVEGAVVATVFKHK